MHRFEQCPYFTSIRNGTLLNLDRDDNASKLPRRDLASLPNIPTYGLTNDIKFGSYIGRYCVEVGLRKAGIYYAIIEPNRPILHNLLSICINL